MPSPPQIFIAYSRKDEELLDELRVHFTPLERSNRVTIWYDGKIEPGVVWEQVIKDHLHQADIILLLVSASAIASDYFYDREVKEALERHDKGSARVVPLILRPCAWQATPLAKLQALPKDGKPVTSWPDRDGAYSDAVNRIWEMIKDREAELIALEEERQQMKVAKDAKAKAEVDRLKVELEEKERLTVLAADNKRDEEAAALKLEQANAERIREEVLEKQKAETDRLKAELEEKEHLAALAVANKRKEEAAATAAALKRKQAEAERTRKEALKKQKGEQSAQKRKALADQSNKVLRSPILWGVMGLALLGFIFMKACGGGNGKDKEIPNLPPERVVDQAPAIVYNQYLDLAHSLYNEKKYIDAKNAYQNAKTYAQTKKLNDQAAQDGIKRCQDGLAIIQSEAEADKRAQLEKRANAEVKKIMDKANIEANKIKAEAKKNSKTTKLKGYKKADDLVRRANVFEKPFAEIKAQQLKSETDMKANKIISQGDKGAKKVMDSARVQADKARKQILGD